MKLELDVNAPLRYLHLTFYGHGDTCEDSGCLKPKFYISYVKFKTLSSLTCPFASYTAGNSVLTCGLYQRYEKERCNYLPNRCRPLRGWKTRPEKERRGRPNRHQSIPAPRERGLIHRFFGEPAHGPPHVAGGASGPIGGCRDESRTDNPVFDLRHVFDRNNRKTDLI